MKILITAGATQEPIDQVRFITNFSTGATGASLAEHFSRQGHEVLFLHGMSAVQPEVLPRLRTLSFTEFRDLDLKLREELGKGAYDAVIHAAAVSDYSVADVEFGGKSHVPASIAKIDSASGEVVLRLRRNFKILDNLKNYAGNSVLKVVGFKLTHTRVESERMAAIQALVKTGMVDLVVHNDYGDVSEGRRLFWIFQASGGVVNFLNRVESRTGLASALEKELKSATN